LIFKVKMSPYDDKSRLPVWLVIGELPALAFPSSLAAASIAFTHESGNLAGFSGFGPLDNGRAARACFRPLGNAGGFGFLRLSRFGRLGRLCLIERRRLRMILRRDSVGSR
jgi:hypothetical protein